MRLFTDRKTNAPDYVPPVSFTRKVSCEGFRTRDSYFVHPSSVSVTKVSMESGPVMHGRSKYGVQLLWMRVIGSTP